MVGRPAAPGHGQAPGWLELMVRDLLLLLPSSLALCAELLVLFILPKGGREDGPATLTPEVMFIEKNSVPHALTLAGLVGKWRGRGHWELHVAPLSLQSMKWLVQGTGLRPAGLAAPYRMTQVDKQGH